MGRTGQGGTKKNPIIVTCGEDANHTTYMYNDAVAQMSLLIIS